MKTKPLPGSRVRLKADFLRNTGQYHEPTGIKSWSVIECSCGLCSRGDIVAVDERTYDNEGMRHFHIANLEKKR